jgi:hypothetical protein
LALRPKISEIGTELSEEEIKKDSVILTKDNLSKVKSDVFGKREISEYTIIENGVVNKSSKIIEIYGKSRNSNYPEGLEYREAVRVLLYLNRREPQIYCSWCSNIFTSS